MADTGGQHSVTTRGASPAVKQNTERQRQENHGRAELKSSLTRRLP